MNKPEQITLACRMAPGVDCLCAYMFPRCLARRIWPVTGWINFAYAFIGGVCSYSRRGKFKVGFPKPGFGPDTLRPVPRPAACLGRCRGCHVEPHPHFINNRSEFFVKIIFSHYGTIGPKASVNLNGIGSRRDTFKIVCPVSYDAFHLFSLPVCNINLRINHATV